MGVLTVVQVGDDYATAATLSQPGAVRVRVDVYNQLVAYELDGSPDGANAWGEERSLGPCMASLARVCSGIRFRNQQAGKIAYVSCELLTDQALAGGGDSIAPQPLTITPGGGVSSTGLPTGMIMEFSGATAPAGTVKCDGSHYDGTQATYAALWAVIGLTYGGSAQADFAVPDRRDRVGVGAGGNTALGANEGIAAANRHATRHRHTPHTHPGSKLDPGAGAAGTNAAGNQQYDATLAADGGSGVGTDPLDGAAYLGLNYCIVL